MLQKLDKVYKIEYFHLELLYFCNYNNMKVRELNIECEMNTFFEKHIDGGVIIIEKINVDYDWWNSSFT